MDGPFRHLSFYIVNVIIMLQLNIQNVRLWFNKQFDELMATKRREVGLVEERNMRLRFIIEGY